MNYILFNQKKEKNMGTRNFYNKNASKIFAVNIEEDFDYQDLQENLQFDLEKFGFNSIDESDNERNFCGKYIAKKRLEFENQNQIVYLEIQAVIRSGYYSGVNLDYDFKIVGDCINNYYNDFQIDEKSDLNYQVARGFKTLFNKAKQALAKEVKVLEKVFAENSEALTVGARFSNGETIYLRENQTMQSYIAGNY